RTRAPLWPVAPAATWLFSSKTTPRPRLARCHAMLVPMQPPPTTTASAVRGTPDAATVSRIECILIVLSFAAFLFPSRYRYRPRMTILYVRGVPMRGRAGHVEARRRRRTGSNRDSGLWRCRLQYPAPRRDAAQRHPYRGE